MEAIDVIGAAVVLLALLRGIWIGVVRELFSLGALAAAICAARWGAFPVGTWLSDKLPQVFGELSATVTAAVLLAIASALVVGFSGRLLRRGLHAAGLGGADRFAGGILGLAEGVLLVGLALWIGIQAFDRNHPSIENTVLLQLFERIEVFVGDTAPDFTDLPGWHTHLLIQPNQQHQANAPLRLDQPNGHSHG